MLINVTIVVLALSVAAVFGVLVSTWLSLPKDAKGDERSVNNNVDS